MAAPNARPGALITDGQERWSVAVCRSLHREGFRVAATADSAPRVAHWSRACDVKLSVPDPHVEPHRFVLALGQALSGRDYSVLIPSGDASLMAISRYRDLIEPHLGAPLGLPPHEVVAAATDKAQLAAAAEAAGIPSPTTAVCDDVGDAFRAAERFGYPVVLKPITSVYEAEGRVWRRGSRRIDDADELARFAPLFGHPCLIQRAEEGSVWSSSGVIAGGEMLAFALTRYLRTWPADAGNAALTETVDPPEGLARQIEGLLARMGWQGIFELELMRRPDGSFASIDLNPRPYGSIALAIAAGADLPAIWAAWLRGERRPFAVARAGVRYRWEDADLRRVVWELRRWHLAEAAEVARPRRHVVHPHFRWNDPGPLLARGAWFARRVIARSRKAPAEPRRLEVERR